MRILPKPQREAMFEIYSFCRARRRHRRRWRPARRRLAQLQHWRADIDALYAGSAAAAPARACSRGARPSICSARTFSPSSTAWRWTWSPTSARPIFATLDLYCDRVASAVGRLSVRVFGMEREAGPGARASSRPRAAAHQYPARPRRGRRDRPALSAARGAGATPASPATILRRCWRVRRSTKPARRSPRAPSATSPKPTAIMARSPRRTVRDAAHHGDGLPHRCSTA